MTERHIQQFATAIRKTAELDHDVDGARKMAETMYRDLLQHIANGTTRYQRLAKAALTVGRYA